MFSLKGKIHFNSIAFVYGEIKKMYLPTLSNMLSYSMSKENI